MFEFITNIGIFSAGAISLLLSIGQWAVFKKKLINVTIAFLFLCLAIIIFLFGAEITGFIFKIPHFMWLNGPCIFSLGPLLFLYFKQLIEPDYKPGKKYILHFMPALISLIALLPLIILSGPQKVEIFKNFEGPFYYLIRITFLVAAISVLLYMIFTLLLVFTISNKELFKGHKIFKITYILIFETTVITLLLAISQISQNFSLFRISFLFINQILLTIYIIGQRYPEFLQTFAKEASRIRYNRSQIQGLHIGSVVKRLKDLMILEEIYTDDELSLQKLSNILNITPHQLSEITNKHIGKSFKSYINYYRLKKAKELLLTNDTESILSIAYLVGFNSKSTFNTLFQKETGMSPTQFRSKKNSSVL